MRPKQSEFYEWLCLLLVNVFHDFLSRCSRRNPLNFNPYGCGLFRIRQFVIIRTWPVREGVIHGAQEDNKMFFIWGSGEAHY